MAASVWAASPPGVTRARGSGTVGCTAGELDRPTRQCQMGKTSKPSPLPDLIVEAVDRLAGVAYDG